MSDQVSALDPTGAAPSAITAEGLPDITQPQKPQFDAATTARLQAQDQHDSILNSPMDRSSGLPEGVSRAVLATESRMDLKQNLLEQMLKKKFGTDIDVAPWGKDNLVYKNPQNNIWTLAEPSAFRAPWQAITSLEPDIAEMVGAAGGAAGGATLGAPGGPPGVVGGGLLGAGAGAVAAREANAAALRGMYGVSDPRTASQVASDIDWTAASNVIGQGLIPAFGAMRFRPRGGPPDPSAIEAAATRGETPPASAAEGIQRARDNLTQRYNTPLRLTGGTQMASPTATGFEAGTSQLPFSPMRANWEQSIVDSGDIADRIGMDILGGGGATPAAGAVGPSVQKTAIGDALHDATQGIVKTFQDTESTLRDQVIQAAGGPNTGVPVGKVIAYRQSLTPQPGDVDIAARQAAIKRADEIINNSKDGFVNLDSLLNTRTDIGQDVYNATNNIGDVVSGSDRYLRGLRNAINTDLRAPGALNPSAQSALGDHDTFVQAYRDPESLNLQGVNLSDVSKMASNYPDAFANAVVNGKTTQGRVFENLVAQLRSMGKTDDANNILAAVFRNIGKPTPSATGAAAAADFSPSVFATKWAGLSDPVKRAFSGTSPEVYASMNDLGTVTKGIQAASNPYNRSETNRGIQLMNMINAAISGGIALVSRGSPTGLAIAAGTFGAIPQLPRALQNPALIRWYTGMLREAGAGRPGWLANAAGRLSGVGLNPDDDAIVRRILGNAAMQDNPPSAQAAP